MAIDITQHIGLVVDEMNRQGLERREWDDCRQDGAEALCRAARSYQPHKGAWSTYATACIRSAIRLGRSRLRPSGEADAELLQYVPRNDPSPTDDAATFAQFVAHTEPRQRYLIMGRGGLLGGWRSMARVAYDLCITREYARRLHGDGVAQLRRVMAC